MNKDITISEKEKRTLKKYEERSNDFPYKVSVEPMINSIKDECDRENLVSYYQMYPLVEKSVSTKDADYIIYANPYARIEDFTDKVLKELENLNKIRKPDSEIIIVGKAVNIKPYIEGKYKNVTYVPSHYAEYLGKRFGLDMKEQYFVYDDRHNRNELNIWPVDGCLQKCGFCRRTYMNIPFESISLDYIKEKLDWYKDNHPEQMKEVNLRAENLTEYGIDIYKEQRLHELIDLLDSYDEIETINLMPIGMCIGEITPKILESLCKCKKLKAIALNLEAGSNRLLKVINKNHTREYAMYIYKTLRKYHPKLYISSTIMIGLPTEELEDILQLADLLNKCEPNQVLCNFYGYVPKHPLAKYKQLDYGVKKIHLDFLLKLLKENVNRNYFLRFSYNMPFITNKRSHQRIKKYIENKQTDYNSKLVFKKRVWFCDNGITFNGDFSWDKYFEKISIYKKENPEKYKMIVKSHSKIIKSLQ